MTVPPSSHRAVALVALALLAGCATTGVRRFPLAAVVWEDDDRRPFSPPPAGFYSPYMWDGADNAFFRPVSELWLFEPHREAINVNAMDEVPDSSWFTNRIGMRPMTPEEIAAGACGTSFDMPEPWTIIGGKPDGANPGFTIRDANGVRYMMKTEGTLQPWRPGAADVIGAAIYHAAGYYAPCNRVVHFDPAILVRDPEARIERSNGSEEPLTQAHVDAVLSVALRLPDGRYRASVSRFVEGRPISPWRYHGVRADDPNDVVPHEHRRELRGMYVLAAWIDHVDSRQENTMAAWIADADSGEGYVRHYVIDFGDCFGVIHEWDALVRRLGHSGYLDFEHIIVDFLTLGVLPRPWFEARYGPAGPTLGYFDAFRFVPDQWRPGYPNPAFDRRTERDMAWMARIIARFRDEHVRALVREGRFGDETVERELGRILIERRDRILERYLTRLSPLTSPETTVHQDGGEVCLQDLAVWSGIRDRDGRRYGARAWAGDDLHELERPRVRLGEDAHVCVRLPSIEEATRDAPVYVIVDVVAQTLGRETTAPARVHLYALAPNELTVVGLERPAAAEVPHP
ncbi:MAG TPA: hypothetical protein VIL20_27635 [Sandaracinaceae bacterium]